MQARVLEPEWLDELPPQDPRAVRSRADLRRVNWVMANARLLAKALTEGLTPGTRIVDLGSGDGSLMLGVANLFLHHLDDASLTRLFALAAQRSRTLAACEPRRSALALAASRLLWFIGCNDVTRHDAVVSVRAGFVDGELSSLWANKQWNLTERSAPPFSHLFVARRDAP